MPRKKPKSIKSGNRPLKTASFLEKSQIGISLTAQALKNLNEIVASTGLSKSKIFEDLITGNLAIASQVAEKTISIETKNEDDSSENITQIQIVEGIVSTENQQQSTPESSDEKERIDSTTLAELKEKIKEHKFK